MEDAIAGRPASPAHCNTYARILRSIDMDRLAALQAQPPINPEPEAVAVSRLAWRERTEAGARYVAPLDRHDVFVRLSAPPRAVQFRQGVLDVRRPAAGEVVICPAHTASYWDEDEAGQTLHVGICPETLARAHGSRGLSPGRWRLKNNFGVVDPVVSSLLRSMLEYSRPGGADSPQFLDAVRTALAIHLLGHHAERPVPSPGKLNAAQLSFVRGYLHDNLACKITIEEVASQLQMTPYQFSRRFQAAVGLSPLRFYMRLRMSRARELVEATALPIGEIAGAVGFSDASQFTKLFRSFWGVTPSQVRSAAGEPEQHLHERHELAPSA